MVTYIEGPFYHDSNLKGKACELELRNRIYQKMVELSTKSNSIYKYQYIKKEKTDE